MTMRCLAAIRVVGTASAFMGLTLLVAASPAAQDRPKIAFEAASVRTTEPGTRMSERVLPNRVDLVAVPLRALVLRAFEIDLFQLSAPDWLIRERFDIHATYPPGATSKQVREMLRALLIDRFGLVTHVESRRVDAYELLVGSGGVKMREVAPVDDLNTVFPPDPSITGSNLDTTIETFDGPVRTMMVPLGGRKVTSRSLYLTWTTAERTFVVDATRITMGEFAEILTANVDKPVVDRTGLGGLYQFKVELDANQSAIRGLQRAGITATVKGTPLNEPTGISTFSVVESLGLKLEERKAPFDIVVVDRIERVPAAN